MLRVQLDVERSVLLACPWRPARARPRSNSAFVIAWNAFPPRPLKPEHDLRLARVLVEAGADGRLVEILPGDLRRAVRPLRVVLEEVPVRPVRRRRDWRASPREVRRRSGHDLGVRGNHEDLRACRLLPAIRGVQLPRARVGEELRLLRVRPGDERMRDRLRRLRRLRRRLAVLALDLLVREIAPSSDRRGSRPRGCPSSPSPSPGST